VTNTNGTLFLAASVSNNPFFTCAVKTDGTVWCWGSNTYGALGIGDTTIASSKTPLQVSTAMASGSPLTGITSVVVADYGYNACAIGAAGAVWCWGYGGYGQLGIGDESNSSIAVPVVVDAGATPVTGFTSISPSYYNTCGMKSDHTVWCWGDNYYGAIGNGSPAMTSTRYFPYPTFVANLAASATSVFASYWNYNVCASTNDQSAYCWGSNTSGNLANGLTTGYSNVPSQVLTAAGTPLTGVARVLNWYGKTCALRTDGSIWCWPDPAGSNYYAVPLKDSQSNRITGLTITGRDCYLDTDDQVWVNGSTSTSYQVTCP
jgi:alpha-tubulin suppressor-like RCC1 family protein